MASTAALELILALKGAKDVADDLRDVGEAGGGIGDALKGGAALAGGAILGLGAVLVGATKAAADDQLAQDQLAQALRNNAKDWDGNTGAVEDYISRMQNLAFEDTELRESLATLTAATGSLTEAQELQATAMDLARMPGMNLQKATKLLTKADDESYAALGRLGIQIDKTTSREDALRIIREKSAGQAETYANSAVGSMERLQNSMGEAMESIGAAILPLVTGPLQQFADWVSSPAVQDGIQSVASAVGGFLAGAFSTLQSIIQTIWPIIQPFIDAWGKFFSDLQGGKGIVESFTGLFSNFGTAVSGAWAVIGPALGEMIGNILKWIGDNGPTILATLGQWAMAFGSWVWNDAIPFLMKALGDLIGALWQFIVDNGPTILAKLWEWTQAFFNWVMNDVLPQLPGWLGNIATALWNFITTNGPVILQKLGEWTGAIMNWVLTDVLPQLPGWLANVAGAVWTFVSTNAPTLLTKLGEWTGKFLSWVMDDIVPQLPGWLGNIAGTLWAWISGAAVTLGDKLINEWIPKFWEWITGPDGVVAKIGEKLAEIWNAITGWIGTTADNIGSEVKKIGENMANGIKVGWDNKWTGDTLTGILANIAGVPPMMNNEIGAKSPARETMPVGENMASGVGAGWVAEWAKQSGLIVASVKKLCDEDIQTPLKKLTDNDVPALMRKLTDDDIVAPIRKLTDNDIPPLIKKLTDDDILAPIRKLCDDDIPTALAAGVEAVRKFCDDDLPAATSSAGADAMKQIWSDVTAAFLSDIDAMRVAYQALQYELANGVSVGNTTVYNGSNGVPPGGGSNYGVGGHTQGGGHNAYAAGGRFPANRTMLVGERGPELLVPSQSGTIIPNHRLGGGINIRIGSIVAGPGTNGAQFASEFVDELEYLVAHRAYTRNPSLARAG